MARMAGAHRRSGTVESGRPTVSCVIPSYENLGMFSRSILSVISQEGVDIEIIVSDDSQSSVILDFVSLLRKRYPEIRYISGARSGNPVENWNWGMNVAKGKYVHVLHHDEFLIDVGFLKRAVNLLEAGNLVAVARSSVLGVSRGSRFALVSRLSRKFKLPIWTLYGFNWIGSTATLVFRNEQAYRFDPRLAWIVDVDLYTRILADPGKVVMMPDVVVGSIGHHANQISAGLKHKELHLRELKYVADKGRLSHQRSKFLSAVLNIKYALGGRA